MTNVKLRETFVTYVAKNIEKYTKHLRKDKPIENRQKYIKTINFNLLNE